MINDRTIHCPCCGAPITGNECQYCGCVIYDFADIDLTGKPSYIRINTDYGIFCGKVVSTSESSINLYNDTVDAVDSIGNIMCRLNRNISCQISLKLDCVVDGGNLFTVVPKDRPYKTALDDWGK